MKTRGSAAVIALAMLLATAGTVTAQSNSSEQMVGRHSMEGQVTSVETKKGWVHVKTAEGTMIVHFPPAALQTVKKGDTITVDLALRDDGPAPAKGKEKR
jgi:hypothetical protein